MKRNQSTLAQRTIALGTIAQRTSVDRGHFALVSNAKPRLPRPYAVLWGQYSRADEDDQPIEQETSPHTARGSEDSIDKKRKRTEAVLFLSKSPVSLRKLAQMAHLADATEARTLVRELNNTYESYGRAFRVELIAGGYRLMTRATLSPWLARLGHLPAVMRLSTPMMETLAVVAYRQAVSRADIEAIRGVACGDLLRQLMEKDLVRIAGRSEELGRPYLYGTTKRFLQLFGLANTESLPPIEWQILQEVEHDPTAENDASETDPEQPLDSTSIDPSTNDDFPSTKESVVSTALASVLSEADSEVLVNLDPNAISYIDPDTGLVEDAQAIIEDEEDELYGDNDDEEDEDDDVDDDDWADDDDDEDDDEEDDDLDEEDDDEDEVDAENADWEEVDDDDEEEWDDDDEEEDDWDDEDDEEEDDDEDWS